MNILEEIKLHREVQLENEEQLFKKPSLKSTLQNKGLSLIAEFKKSSPSKGEIINDLDLDKLADRYIKESACAFSVLTEEKFFKGSNENLSYLSTKYPQIPCLRKDFIYSPFMVAHSKFIGSSAILLIVSMLNEYELLYLHQLALSLNLDVLVEIHNEHELKIALKIPNLGILGINNRDLNTFNVDINTSLNLLKLIPKKRDFALVSESGFSKLKQLETISNAGFDGILIGESMVKGGLK